jgi:mannose-6-phosphate isomerase-like protein (cupin superfamily)
MAFVGDIVERARVNTAFREVVATGPHAQVVVMCLPPNTDIGLETHAELDQILVVVGGEGAAILDAEQRAIRSGSLVLVPAGTRHNIVNTGPIDLRLYTVYAPPGHAPGTIHLTKAVAEQAELAERAEAGPVPVEARV